MQECECEATEETRNYIKACEKFWNMFNDPKPLSTIKDCRISQLDEVVKYFEDWNSWLCTQNKKKRYKLSTSYLGKQNLILRYSFYMYMHIAPSKTEVILRKHIICLSCQSAVKNCVLLHPGPALKFSILKLLLIDEIRKQILHSYST